MTDYMVLPFNPDYLEQPRMSARLKAAYAAQAEFRKHRASLGKLGLTEDQFVLSRLKDLGFSRVEIEPERKSDGRPAHVRVPGLLVEFPTGNQVGA
ncbi:MAG: hypothetical protein U0939_21930 [Pirellulales bacterium]